jgi:hypothetical protein
MGVWLGMMNAGTQGRVLCFLTWLPFLFLASAVAAQETAAGIDADGNRSFFHWDMNASGFYSSRGATLSGVGSAHWQPTDRIPRNYVGCEYIGTIGETSPLRTWLGPLELTTMDLNPHLEVDFNPPLDGHTATLQGNTTSLDINSDNGNNKVRFKLVLHDFWLRFEPQDMARTTLRVGHFDIPYGINPVMAPRGGVFVMPPEIDDIGLKKDWGIDWKGPLGHYDYELAATTGTGLGLHSPNWFCGSAASYLLSARAGAPTYWNFQYGLSGLYGRIPTVMADERFDAHPIERWRINVDAFFKLQEHTMFMSQVGFGQNGAPFDHDPMRRADVLAAHFLVDHVPPWFQLMDFKVQFKTFYSDLSQSHSDHTLVLFEAAYSLSTPVMIRLDYVHDFTIPKMMEAMGQHADDRVFMTINYYE